MEVATPARPEKRKLHPLVEFVLILGAALLLAFLVQALLVKPYTIPSESMEPTLDVGQHVFVSRVNHNLGGAPDRNDIVVFHPPEGSKNNDCGAAHPSGSPCPLPTPRVRTGDGDTFIKRVVALPGDTIAIREGHAVVNGVRKVEKFTRACPLGSCNFPKAVKVPAGHFFMMGDNRGRSDDSRFWGPVPKKWIIGEAFFTYWPPKRVGSL